MKIVFDSTVLIKDFHMSGPSFRLFEWFLSNREATLVVPQIVLEEVKNKYFERCQDYFETTTKALRKLNGILDQGFSIPLNSYDLQGYHEIYCERLSKKLKDLNTDIPDHEDIPHKDIVLRDLSRRLPFRRIGKGQRESVGYRDVLLWEVMLGKVAPDCDSIVFISNNKRDFCDKGSDSLHKDLIQDLIQKGFPHDHIIILDSLETFNTRYTRPEIPMVEEARIFLERGKYKDFSIKDWLDENSMELARNLEETEMDFSFLYVDVHGFTIELIEGIYDLQIDAVLELDEETVIIEISFWASVSFELYFYGHGYVSLYDHFHDHISVTDVDDHGANVSISLNMPINVALTLDIETIQIEGFEASFQETHGICRHCGRFFTSDAQETCPNCGI